MVMAMVPAGPGMRVGYRTRDGRGIDLGRGENKSYDNGKQRGRNNQGENLFHGF
jgi:hypothetical protein